MKIFCACGCGEKFKEYDKWGRKRKFIYGHQQRGKLHSNWKGGYSIILKPQLCDCGCGQLTSGKWNAHTQDYSKFIPGHQNKGKNNPRYGKKVSKESIKKRLETLKRKGISWKGRKHSEEAKRKISLSNKGRKFSKEIRDKMSKNHWSKRGKKSHNKGKTKENYEPLKRVSIKMKNGGAIIARKGNKNKPTKPEKILNKLFQKYFPNQWKYVGCGDFILGGKNPDFINCNGQKKIIELFGDYWHKKEDEEIRSKHFLRYGFKTLIIWEHELKDINSVLKRINDF